MAKKTAKEQAYNGGYALPDTNFTLLTAVPLELRYPGVHHCPFDARDPEQADEREHWLRGLRDRLAEIEKAKSPAEALAEVREALR